MVTMQQIADRCGVSRGTVDRALHHKEGVREEVAERIRATAREMGYISNRLVMQQTPPVEDRRGAALRHVRPFVRMLCELFASFSERELHPERHGDRACDAGHGCAAPADADRRAGDERAHRRPGAYAAGEHARTRHESTTLSEQHGHPGRDASTRTSRTRTASPMSVPDNIAARPRRRGADGHGHAGARQRAADSGSAQRSLCRTRSVLPASARKWRRVFRISGFCIRNARFSMKALPSASRRAPSSRTARCAAST